MRQKQTVFNLYNAGILPEVIAMQLDITKEQVENIIAGESVQNDRKNTSVKKASAASSLGMFYLDAVVNIDNIIKSAQVEIWNSLKGEMEFEISTGDTQIALAKVSGSKVTFVILYIDIVGSTKLSMTLPVDKLSAIIRAFSKEMSLVISAYGGYVLKYIGDAILAFFIVPDKSDSYMPCVNAVHCGRSMIRAVKEGFNPILNQEDYPELSVRVGIDVGEVVIVQYGWTIQSSIAKGDGNQTKIPHHDILGYTVSMASKITGLAEPNQMVIGQYVHDVLGREQKDAFKPIPVPSNMWSYVSSKTGNPYKLYVRSSC